MYVVDEKNGQLTHTQSTRIIQQRGRIRFGAKKKIDNARIEKLKATIQEMCDLNRDTWNYLDRLAQHLRQKNKRDVSKSHRAN